MTRLAGELQTAARAAPRLPVGNRRLLGLAPAPGSPDDAPSASERSPVAWRVRAGSVAARLGHPECE